MPRRSLKYNAAVLTVTGFLVKAFGFLYRVVIANSIGSEGLGLYQLVTPIYSFLVLVLSAGISVAVSRFVAEEISKNFDYKSIKIASLSAGLVMIAGLITCSILVLNLDTLVLSVTRDVRTRRSLLGILILVPPIAAASAFKGYFYGRQEMIPNAIGQILEQVSKLVVVLLLFKSFEGRGVESMCFLAVMAMLVGECVNVLVVYIAYLMVKRKSTALGERTKTSSRALLKKIFGTAMPITANRFVLSTIGTAESLLIPQRLVHYGLTFQESLMSLGRLSGMASPLVFFPSMLPGALATALIPAIASAVASKKYYVANRQISQSIRLTLIMGLMFTSIFACCSHEIAELVYPGENVGGILYLLSFTGVFLYLQQAMLGILNGLARERSILLNTLIGSFIRIVIIWFGMPLMGLDAYIYGVIAGSFVGVILNFREISKLTGISIDVGEWLLKPIAATLTGTFAALVLKRLPVLFNLSGRMAMLWIVVFSSAAILGAFLLLGIIKREDLKRWSGKQRGMMFELL